MKHTAKGILFVLMSICFIVTALPPYCYSFVANVTPRNHANAAAIPTLDAEGTVISVSETEKEHMARLFSAANPSDLLLSFDAGDDIDQAMWIAGFAAGYAGGEAGGDTGLFEETPYFDEDAEAHFANLWAAYFDGWDLLDGAVPPADILPYSIDGSVSDSMYYRIENVYMQSLIKGVFGREMLAPQEHIRYFDGNFYFGHIGDFEERLLYGYDYTVENVYDLHDGYYRIEGKASYYYYASGELEDEIPYEALVKKDDVAEYSYYLMAQRFGEFADRD